MADVLLDVDKVSLSFAGVRALRDVSLSVSPGELLAVIGPNGAGKTSLFNSICGVYKPQQGEIRFRGDAILGRSPDEIAGIGVARMFQNLALFEQMTVLENMMLGCHTRYQSAWWHKILWTPQARAEEVHHRTYVEKIIEFLHLESYRKMPVGILPYGILKRVELGRSLAMRPILLLLDEPAAGLNQEETEDLARYLLDIKNELEITQVLIEHELHLVLDIADRVAVLDFGQKIADGSPDEVRNDQAVIDAYLGGGV